MHAKHSLKLLIFLLNTANVFLLQIIYFSKILPEKW